jgi:hypothetical protein
LRNPTQNIVENRNAANKAAGVTGRLV